MPRNKRLKDALGGRIRKLAAFVLTHVELTAAAMTQDFAAFATLPAGAMPVGVELLVTEVFTGLTAPQIALIDGEDGGSALATTIQDVLTGDAPHVYIPSGNDAAGFFLDGENLNMQIAATNNLDQATAGRVEITVLYVMVSDVQP